MIRPKIFNEQEVIAAQSMRTDDVITDSEKLFESQSAFFAQLGIDRAQLASSKQVHSNNVLVAKGPIRSEGYDAVITNVKNVFVVVAVADCTPVLIHDEKNRAVAAIHAGWRGTVGKIVQETLRAMRENYGTKGEDCKVFIGACISEKIFEVGEEVAVNFKERMKRFDPASGKYFVDLKKENKDQLMELGVKEKNVEVSDYCTVMNNDKFYSYRKEKGKTGRLLAVIGLKD
jgi:polyphenol oxidase